MITGAVQLDTRLNYLIFVDLFDEWTCASLLEGLPGGVITLEQWNAFVDWAVEKAYIDKWEDGHVDRATLYGMWMRSLEHFIKVGKVDVSDIEVKSRAPPKPRR